MVGTKLRTVVIPQRAGFVLTAQMSSDWGTPREWFGELVDVDRQNIFGVKGNPNSLSAVIWELRCGLLIGK